MKKVLILAYDFPPYVSVGGLRPFSWRKHMHEFGLYPIIVTRQWQNKHGNHLDYVSDGYSDKIEIEETETGTIIRTPYKSNLSNRLLLKYGGNKFKIVRKIITAYYYFFQFLFFVGPKSRIYFAAKDYLQSNKVDVIIATGNPFVLFRYASILGKKHNIPWIADYRDGWSVKKNIKKNIILYLWNSYFERKISNTSIFITTPSQFTNSVISNFLNNNNVHLISNGYDCKINPDEGTPSDDREFLNIGYIGTIYEYHPFKQFLISINKQNYKIRLNLYGTNINDTIKHILETEVPEIKDKIFFHNKISYDKLVSELNKNHVFLLFNDYYLPGTKIYDYLALKKNILFCFKNDDNANTLMKKHFQYDVSTFETPYVQEEIINRTNSGYIIENQKHLQDVLDKLYTELKNKGMLDCKTNLTEDFSRKYQIEKLSKLIKTTLSHS
ncbi:MAG: hypothetical protein A3F72_05085 [Bacteroidetes bacterium RIFCSPLOWO2_12_FULL_35_15]|nr:MAG: hypothetical protein A3F72_05085 [Bacteroidetes bacterium RIFCSPLOWO2_12_FULL_35_15]